jgi:glucose uptake protein GlcU
VFAATKRRLPARADWGRGKDVWLGIAAGATWGVANMGIDVSIDAGVPLGTANSIFQASIVVSGAWGIFYGELEGKQPILLVVVASVIFLGGIFLLTFSAGSESLEASPPAAPPLALTAS